MSNRIHIMNSKNMTNSKNIFTIMNSKNTLNSKNMTNSKNIITIMNSKNTTNRRPSEPAGPAPCAST